MTNINTAVNNIYVQKYLKDNNLEQYGRKRTATDDIDTRKRKLVVRFSSIVEENPTT